MAAASLPQEVVLKSRYNGTYLEYVKDEGKAKGFLRFTNDDFASPLSKFEVELAKSDSQLVHLKSSYNNKYLRTESRRSRWIVSEADEPEEDQSKWSCTLFQPVPSSGDFLFKHVKIGNYLVLMRMGPENAFDHCLFAAWPTPDKNLCDLFTVTDWKSLVLPRYVAFQGDNGKYLSARIIGNGQHYLQFDSLDVTDETAAHEVFWNPDGSIRLKSTHFGRFWRRTPNWVFADSDDTSTNDKSTLFWPVRVDQGIVALRSMDNDLFCKRFSMLPAVYSGLKADDPTITVHSRLRVTDLTHSG